MKKNVLYGIVVVFLLVVLVAGCSDAPSAPTGHVTKETYKLGVILPLSGDLAMIGQEMQRGIDLGIEYAKGQGVSIQAIYEDNEFLDARKSVTAAQSLISKGVDGIITSMVIDALPVAPLAEEAKVPLIDLWDATEDIASYDYSFSVGFRTEDAGKQMADYAFTQGVRRIAVVDHHDPWSKTISTAFMEEFDNLGGTIVFEDTFEVTENDYRLSLIKAMHENVDAIYAPLVPPSSVNFFDQRLELGLGVPVLSADGLIEDVIDATPKGVEGVVLTNVYVSDSDLAKDLLKSYEETYGGTPLILHAVQMGFDAVAIYADAFKRGGDLREAILNTDADVSGPKIRFDEHGLPDKEEKLFVIEDGKYVPLVR